MGVRISKPGVCPIHGKPTERAACRACNAAYMRAYLRRRRLEQPALAVWERARKRARRRGVKFTLSREAVVIPDTCPALGIAITVGATRSVNSPSLDRIRPMEGYVRGNVRVISDHANRLKGGRNQDQLESHARCGRPDLREDYAKLAAYVDREAILAEVRSKAAAGGRMGKEWAKIEVFLDRAFQKGLGQ
jgi:hypothetical protein